MKQPANDSKNERQKLQPGDSTPQRKKPLTTKELMRKHISDKNDVITDEDIRNLTVELTDENAGIKMDNSGERPKDKDKDHDTKTPWDVIDPS